MFVGCFLTHPGSFQSVQSKTSVCGKYHFQLTTEHHLLTQQLRVRILFCNLPSMPYNGRNYSPRCTNLRNRVSLLVSPGLHGSQYSSPKPFPSLSSASFSCILFTGRNFPHLLKTIIFRSQDIPLTSWSALNSFFWTVNPTLARTPAVFLVSYLYSITHLMQKQLSGLCQSPG